MTEEWRPVVGYEGLYEVSNLGKVRSLFRYKKELKPNYATNYPTVQLFKDKKCKNVFIHRLVAIAFVPNPDNKPYVNHIDEVKTNFKFDNLEWVTPSENTTYGNGIKRKVANTDYSKESRKQHCRENGAKAAKPVLQYKNGIFQKRYDSLMQAERETKIKPSNIVRCLKSNGKYTAGGYEWKYENEVKSHE